MPSLIATQALRYAEREMSEGDAFDASESDAFVLKAAGKARDAVPQQRRPAVTKTRTLKPDEKEDDGSVGRYQRADMRAQDE